MKIVFMVGFHAFIKIHLFKVCCFSCSKSSCSQVRPVQVPRWPSNLAPRIKTKFKEFSGDIIKKFNSPGPVDFSPGS